MNNDSGKPFLTPALWVKSYGDSLFSYALLKTGNRETAEDLLQETFISAIKAQDTFNGLSSEKTWLTAILKNKIIDHYRKKNVLNEADVYIRETESDFSKHFFEADNGHWLNEAAPLVSTEFADFNVRQAEFNRVIEFCLHKMPSRLMPVFVARFLDNEDSENICKVHNLSPSNYWVIIHRAKLLFRACLEKNWL